MSNADAIEHVIMVVFENRSFDHLLGWMSHPNYNADLTVKVEGLTGDLDPVTGELVNPTYRNPALLQTFRPFFSATDDPLATDLPHGRDEVHTQMAYTQVTNSYAMQGFAASYFHENPAQAGPFATKPDCMRMLAPSVVPMTAWLAENYCVCDHWFTPIPTDTHPNRMMAIAGYSEIQGTTSHEPDEDIFADWADRNGVSWRVYSGGFSFMTIMGTRGPGVLAQRVVNGTYRGISSFAHDYQYDASFPAITLIEPAFSDDPLATQPNDNHPPLQMGPGEAYLIQIYNALFGTQLARDRFAKTMLLVYYDEHGGFFDHIPPLNVQTPSGRLGTPTQWPTFLTTGPRVPAIVVSPMVDAGVFTQNLDHTSVLRFLGERFGKDGTYSPEVTARHATPGAGLCSIGDAVNRSTPRAAPEPPNFGQLAIVSRPSGQPPHTPGQQAFQAAHDAAEQNHAQLADASPEHFFVPRTTAPPSGLQPIFVDVYQGDLNGKPAWAAAAADPRVNGAILKVSEGMSANTAWFGPNWAAIHAVNRQLGVDWFCGAYHYLRFADDANAQADFFLKTIQDAGGLKATDLWPIVDVEEADNPGATGQQVIDATSTFSARIKAVTGRDTMLYGGSLMRDLHVTSRMGCRWLWTARYSATPAGGVDHPAGMGRGVALGLAIPGHRRGGCRPPCGLPNVHRRLRRNCRGRLDGHGV